MLKRALFTAALLTLIVLTPAFAQRVSEEIFVPAAFDPFDPEILTDNGLVIAPCTDGGLVQEPLPDGAQGFTIAGEFLQVKADDLCRAFTIPLEVGVPYKAIYIEFDLKLDRWVTPIFHNIASLRRPGPKRHERVLYWGLIIRGDRRRTLLDLGAERSVKQDHPWQEHTQYRLVMEANLPGKRIKMDVFNSDGDWVFGTQGKMTAREIRSLGGERSVKVDFSSGGIAHHAYFPPTGWTFSNLKVTAVP